MAQLWYSQTSAVTQECLTNEEHGYYSKRQVFGVQGDFITSPEVSQMFGEVGQYWTASAGAAQCTLQPAELPVSGSRQQLHFAPPSAAAHTHQLVLAPNSPTSGR